MALVTIVGWVYKLHQQTYLGPFYHLSRLTSRAFAEQSLWIFSGKKRFAKENHHFLWVNPLFQWPFSRAMLVYQGVLIQIQANIYLAIPVLPDRFSSPNALRAQLSQTNQTPILMHKSQICLNQISDELPSGYD